MASRFHISILTLTVTTLKSTLHIASEWTQELRQQYDTLKEKSGQSTYRMDLYGLLVDHTEDETLSKFWDQTVTNFASTGTAEVLVRTGGFSTRKLLVHLLDTFQILLQVTESLDAIKPGGVGHVTTIRVRHRHAMVHGCISNLAEVKPDYFDSENLDCIHSISTFRRSHSWLQLPLMGSFISVARSKATMESILLTSRINPNSHIKSHNFVECLKDLPPVNMSVLNGDEFCDQLGLGKPRSYSSACFKGFSWLVSSLAFMQGMSCTIDRSITGFFQRALHHAVIQSISGLAGGSKLQFKYTPKIGKKMGKEDNDRSTIFLPSAIGFKRSRCFAYSHPKPPIRFPF
ncbi:hypothetical protein BGW36DRAFT_397669 [Talaromyces proteolyticus]|uniref:Uncharacterized protein n=1 Tax=Talaromyces proteolyticus TaxID=1131652 RepID=A0AAD4PZI1_9EURO|nr:uncharacterized protein BGW36DRAFT_397669 [Talaromyces proteolyticus]KAH8696006.1 hypothetical protein BGW36DRAFT_397669 [Talaromyces proteolyticus]